MLLSDILRRCDPDMFIEIQGCPYLGKVSGFLRSRYKDIADRRTVAVLSVRGECLYITLGCAG